MTSSRFPIGVAQTASGIRRSLRPASSASKPTSPAPTRPGVERPPAPARGQAHDDRAAGTSASRSSTSRAGSSRELVRASPQPPPITIALGVEDVHRTRAPSRAAGPIPSRSSSARSSPSRARSIRSRVRARAEHLLGLLRRPPRPSRRPRDGRGRCTSPGRRPVVLDHDVPELGRRADAPRYGLPSRISPPPTPVPRVSMIMRASRARPRPATRRSRPRWRRCRSRTAGRSGRRCAAGAERPRAGCSRTRRRAPSPGRPSTARRGRSPRTPSSNELLDGVLERPTTSSSEMVGVGTPCATPIPPSRSTTPAAIFVPPRSTPMTRFADMGPWLR